MKCLTTFVAAAGIPLSNEVHFDGRERPADVFIDRWATPDPEAVDVTVTHPLAGLFLTGGEGGGHPARPTCAESNLWKKRRWRCSAKLESDFWQAFKRTKGRRIGGAGR